jgi:hypothetical protein
LYYDHDGNFRGVENGVDFQDSDVFLRMKWWEAMLRSPVQNTDGELLRWKLMLSPLELPVAMKDQMSTELPRGKTIIDVFADFMRYLFDSTEALFKSSEPNGELRWNSISQSIELVLTHPNGWRGPQQSRLRAAAVKAGIVRDTPAGHARVRFVSEGEASFSFCATKTHAGENLKVCHVVPTRSRLFTRSQPGDQALIIDAGGGTIDISTYTVLNNGPLRVEELYEPECELDAS